MLSLFQCILQSLCFLHSLLWQAVDSWCRWFEKFAILHNPETHCILQQIGLVWMSLFIVPLFKHWQYLQRRRRVDSGKRRHLHKTSQARIPSARSEVGNSRRAVRQKVRNLFDRQKRSKNETSTEAVGHFLTPGLLEARAKSRSARLSVLKLKLKFWARKLKLGDVHASRLKLEIILPPKFKFLASRLTIEIKNLLISNLPSILISKIRLKNGSTKSQNQMKWKTWFQWFRR